MKRSLAAVVFSGLLLSAVVMSCKRSDTQPAHAPPAEEKHHAPMATPGTEAGPAPAAQGIDAEGQMHISEGDRCPVCAMKVKTHSRFAAGIALDDGRTFYTCGTGCLIRSHLHPERYLKADKSRIRKAVVQDYLGGRHIDALGAVWVAGSDLVGPMGPMTVPLASEEDAATFRERHGGTSTFRLGELTDEKWEALTMPGKQH